MKHRIPLKNSFPIVIVVLTLFVLTSCAKKISFQTSAVVPAAQGTVKMKKDKNDNYTIHVNLSNLSDPGRLQPPMKTYVIWMESNDARLKNIGQINSSTGFLSKRLKASFETVSSVKPSKLFITAEEDGTVQYPGMQVLTTPNF